MKQLGIR